MSGTETGRLYGIGVGPGDPELLTLKAARILRAVPVIAHFAKRGRCGHARSTAETHMNPEAEELRLEYPFTTEVPVESPAYHPGIDRFYDEAADALARRLDRGADVAVLCEGDPFFYGSFMYAFDRLHQRYRIEVVPGITGMSGCWARALQPMTHGDDVLSVIPATLDEEPLAARLSVADAAVVMKVGRHLPKVRSVLGRLGLLDRAVYVEGGTMAQERIVRLADMAGDDAPYFSIVLVPGRRRVR